MAGFRWTDPELIFAILYPLLRVYSLSIPAGRGVTAMMPQDPQQPWRPDQPYCQGQQQQYPPPPYPPQGQPYGQPPRPPRRTGRKILIGIASAFALIIVIGIIGAAAGGGKTAPAAAQSSAPATTAAPAATHSSTPARAAAAPKVTYVVTGTPGADITYGPAGSSLSGHSPMRVTRKLGHALYYSIQAQLQGSGEVTVKILIGGKVISKAVASGGYNIAMAEISQNPLTGKWEDTQQS